MSIIDPVNAAKPILAEALEAWAPMIASGYECPAAAQPMYEASKAIVALTTERDHWKEVAEMNATSGAFTFKHLGIAHEALARAEAERDALRKEVEELKHDLARYVDIATEHVNEVEEWPALIKIMIDQARTNSGSVPMDERQRDAYLSALCHIEIGIDNAVEYRRRARAALVDAEKGGE